VTTLVINAESCFSVGLHIDRDHITVVVLDSVGNVRARASRRSRARQRPTLRRQAALRCYRSASACCRRALHS
jgi:predicted NBD/HSP70 family sugar kinase